jgi:sugar phosphate isomerase/epimerase
MRIVLHAPDDAVSLYQCSRHLRDGMLEYFRALFSFAEQIGVQLITIHAGRMTEFPTDTTSEERMPSQDYAIYAHTATENLRRILELADRRFTICVENYKMDAAVIELLMPFLERKDLALCWDLAKSNSTVEPFFLEHLRHVKQVHLHDRRRTPTGLRGHRVIGTGELDFRYYFDVLQQADVLDYCIEVRPQEKARESLIALQNILGTEI